MLALVEKPQGGRPRISPAGVFGMRVLLVQPGSLRGGRAVRLERRLLREGVSSCVFQTGETLFRGIKLAGVSRLYAEFAVDILRCTAEPGAVVALWAPRYSALTDRLLRQLCAYFGCVMLSLEYMPPGLGERLLDSLGAAVVLSPGEGRLSRADFGIVLGERTLVLDRDGKPLTGFCFETAVGQRAPAGFDPQPLISAALDCGALQRQDVRLVKKPEITKA